MGQFQFLLYRDSINLWKKIWEICKKLDKILIGTEKLSRKYRENYKKVLVLSNISWNFEKKIRGIFRKTLRQFWKS